MKKIFRQGDVMIVEVLAIPKAATKEQREGDIILAHGEVTGHAHRIAAKTAQARMWSAGAERFLQAMEMVSLKHEEHSALSIPPGNYQVVIQQEYTPGALRNVAD